jgi:dTDP-4-dehydrorhamnose reductase
MKKRVLIIGASGLLGTHWIIKEKNNFFFYANIHKKLIKNYKINKIYLNLKNKKIISNFLKDKNIDFVINTSGITNVDKCEKFKKKSYFANYTIPKNLVYGCKINDIPLIHISTDHLFSSKKKIKFLETFNPRPINYYAQTKFYAENYIKLTLEKYIIIRTNFFSLLNTRLTFLHKIFLLEKKNTLELSLWNNVFYTPVHANTVIDIAHSLLKKKKYGIFNVSSNEILSKFSFYSLIKKFFKLNHLIFLKEKKDFKKDPNIVDRPLNMSLNNKKITNIFPSFKLKLNIKNQILMLKKDMQLNKKYQLSVK